MLRAAHGMRSPGVERRVLPVVILIHPVRVFLPELPLRLRHVPHQAEMFRERRERRRRDGARRRHRGHAHPREDAVAASHEFRDRGEHAGLGNLREGEGAEEPPARLERGAVRASVSPEETLVGQRRRVNLNLHSGLDVRDDALDGVPQDLRALALVILVLLRVAVLALPQVEGLGPGGVDVDDVLPLGRHLGVEHGGDEDGHHVLWVPEGTIPIQHREMRRVQIRQTLGVDAEEQVHDGPECRNLRHVLLPIRRLRQPLRLELRAIGKQRHRVPHRGVRHHSLGGARDASVLQPHPRRLAVLHDDLLDVLLELHRPAEFLQRADEFIHDSLRAADGRAQTRAGTVETRDGVDHRRAHGALRGETAEKREHVDPLLQERLGDVLPGQLVERVEDVGDVEHHLGVGEVEGDGDDGAHQKARVLTQSGERARVEGVVERLEAVFQRLPLLDGELGVGGLLAKQVAKAAGGLVVANLEPPVALRGPHGDAVVRLARHLLVQGVEHHAQGVSGGSIEALPDGGAHLKLPQPAVLVPVVEHVAAPAGEVMRLEHLHLVPVLGEQGRGAQAADAATDDDDVVLLFGVRGGRAGGGRDGSVRGVGTRDGRRIATTRPKRADAADGRETRGRRDRGRRATGRDRGGDARRASRAAGDGRARGARRHRRRRDGHRRRRSRRTRPRRARSRSVDAPRRCSRTVREPVHDLSDSPSALRSARPAFRGDALERRARNAARWRRGVRCRWGDTEYPASARQIESQSAATTRCDWWRARQISRERVRQKCGDRYLPIKHFPMERAVSVSNFAFSSHV